MYVKKIKIFLQNCIEDLYDLILGSNLNKIICGY